MVPAPDAFVGLPILGMGQHTISALEMTTIAERSIGLERPTDLAFHPQRKNELWITSQADDSVVLIINPGKANILATILPPSFNGNLRFLGCLLR